MHLRLAHVVRLLPWCALTACSSAPPPGQESFDHIARTGSIHGIRLDGDCSSIMRRLTRTDPSTPALAVQRRGRVITIERPTADLVAVRLHDDGAGNIALMETILQRSGVHAHWRAHAHKLGLEPGSVVGDYTGIRRLDETSLAPDQRQGSGVVVYASSDPEQFLLVDASHDQLYGTIRVLRPSDWSSLREFRTWEHARTAIRAAISRHDSDTAARLLANYARVDDAEIHALRRAAGQLANTTLSDTKLRAQRAWSEFVARIDREPLDRGLELLRGLESLENEFVDAHGNRLAMTDGWSKTAWGHLVARAASDPGTMTQTLGRRLADQQPQWRNRLHHLASIARGCVELDAAATFAERAAAFERIDAQLDRGMTQVMWQRLRPAARGTIARALRDEAEQLDPERTPHALAAHRVVAKSVAASDLDDRQAASLLAVGAALDEAAGLHERLMVLRDAFARADSTRGGAQALRDLSAPTTDALPLAVTEALSEGRTATAAALALWHYQLTTGRCPGFATLTEAGEHPSDTPWGAASRELARLAARILPAVHPDGPHVIDEGEVLYALVTDWPLVRNFGIRPSRAGEPWLLRTRDPGFDESSATDVLSEPHEGASRWIHRGKEIQGEQPSSIAAEIERRRSHGPVFPQSFEATRAEMVAERAWLDVAASHLAAGIPQLDRVSIERAATLLDRNHRLQQFDPVERAVSDAESRGDAAQRNRLRQLRREFDRRRAAFNQQVRGYNRQLTDLKDSHRRWFWDVYATALHATRDDRVREGAASLKSSEMSAIDRDRELAWRAWIFGCEAAGLPLPPSATRSRVELQVLRGALSARIRLGGNAVDCARHLLRDLAAVPTSDGDLVTVMVRSYLDAFGVESFAVHVGRQSPELDRLLRGIARKDRQRIQQLVGEPRR